MPKSKKGLVLAGAAAIGAFFLFGRKKASAKSKVYGEGGDGSGTGGYGQPVGPTGCAPGLVVNEDGICVTPEEKEKGHKPKPSAGGKSGGSNPPPNLKAADFWISSDCKTVKFGDDTGEAWWAQVGYPTAQLWADHGYENPWVIAYEMLKNISPCIMKWPRQEEDKSRIDLEIEREQFLRDYPEVYNLILSVSFRIDEDLFDRKNMLYIDPDQCLVEYEGDDWWAKYGIPLSLAYYEMSTPGTSKQIKSWHFPTIDGKMLETNSPVIIGVLRRYAPECTESFINQGSPGGVDWAEDFWAREDPLETEDLDIDFYPEPS